MKSKKLKNYRHGDLALIGISSLPVKNLKNTDSKILLSGSHGNNHIFDNGEFYPYNDENNFSTIGFLIANNTTLYHPDHGKKVKGNLREAKIDDGIYHLLRQVEFTHEGMRQVVD